jgi:hypothetical protein
MGGDDKTTVQEIKRQSIGGLKFFRQPNCDLKLAHRDYEFIGQFLGINRANIDTWPKRPHFARHLVRGSSRDLPLGDWDHACAGHGSFCNCYRCTGFRGKCKLPAPVMRNSAPGWERSFKKLQGKIRTAYGTCVMIRSRAGLLARLRNCKGQPACRPETVLVREGSTGRAYL